MELTTTTPPAPTIHAAERASGPSGAVDYDPAEISIDDAIARRRQGLDVVVRGVDKKANRTLAQNIESAVGAWTFHPAHNIHRQLLALPHFQHASGAIGGHCFYEIDTVKARRKR